MHQSTIKSSARAFEDALQTVSFYADKTWFIPAAGNAPLARSTSSIPGFDPNVDYLIANQHLWVRLKSADFNCLYSQRRFRDLRSFSTPYAHALSMDQLAKTSSRYHQRISPSFNPHHMLLQVRFKAMEKVLQEKRLSETSVSRLSIPGQKIVKHIIPASHLAIYAGNHTYNEYLEKFYVGEMDVDQKIYPNGGRLTPDDFADSKICYCSDLDNQSHECWMLPEVQEKCRKLLSSPKLDDEPLDKWEAEILNRNPAVLGRLWSRRFPLAGSPSLFSPPPPPCDLSNYPIRQYSIGEFYELQILHNLNSERIRSLWKWPPVVQPPILAFCLPEMPSMIRPEPGYQQSLFPYLTKIPTSSAVSRIPVYTRPVELYHQEQRRRTAGVDFRNLISLTPTPEYPPRTVITQEFLPLGYFPTVFLPPFPPPPFPPPMIYNISPYGPPFYEVPIQRNLAMEQPPPPGTEDEFSSEEMTRKLFELQPLDELTERISKLEAELLAIDTALEEPVSTQPPDLIKSEPILLSDISFSECLQDSSSTLETDSSVWDSPGDRPRRLYSDVLTGTSPLNDWNPKEQPPIPGEQDSPSKEDGQKEGRGSSERLLASIENSSLQLNQDKESSSERLLAAIENISVKSKQDKELDDTEITISFTESANDLVVNSVEIPSPVQTERSPTTTKSLSEEPPQILQLEDFPSLPSAPAPVAKSSPCSGSSPGSWPSSPLHSSDARSISSEQSPLNNANNLGNLSRNSKRNRTRKNRNKKNHTSQLQSEPTADPVFLMEKTNTLPDFRGMMPIEALEILSSYVYDCSYSFQLHGGRSMIPVLVPSYTFSIEKNLLFFEKSKSVYTLLWPETDFYYSFINRISQIWWNDLTRTKLSERESTDYKMHCENTSSELMDEKAVRRKSRSRCRIVFSRSGQRPRRRSSSSDHPSQTKGPQRRRKIR